MQIQYIAKDLSWSESMKARVQDHIARPFAHRLGSNDFQMSFHLEERADRYALWLIVQTFDGQSNQVVRCIGKAFEDLVEGVSEQLDFQLRDVAV